MYLGQVLFEPLNNLPDRKFPNFLASEPDRPFHNSTVKYQNQGISWLRKPEIFTHSAKTSNDESQGSEIFIFAVGFSDPFSGSWLKQLFFLAECRLVVLILMAEVNKRS